MEAKVGQTVPEATVLQLLGRIAPVGAWSLDLERDRFSVVLEPKQPIIGGEEELERLVRSPQALLDASSVLVWGDALERARTAGHPWDLILGFHATSGGQGWIRTLGLAECREGKVVRLDGVVQDVTLAAAVESELMQLHKLQVLGDVVPGLAELRDLLVAIGQYDEAAAEALPEWHPAQHDLTGLASMLGRACTIVEELLSLAGESDAEPAPLDLVQVIGDIYPALRRALGARIAVDVIHATRLSPVLADRAQLEQAILSLVLSAQDGLPDGGALTLMTHDVVSSFPLATLTGMRPPGAYVELALHDTGPGMDDAARTRLFRPGLDGSAGLGLLRCLRIVRHFEGLMDVESAPGEGTTVRLWLPAARGAAGARAGEPA